MEYRIVRISKGNGKFRTIYVPSAALKHELRSKIQELEVYERKQAKHSNTEDIAHGCIVGRSPVTMAREHRLALWTLSIDLTDCFDSVGHLLNAKFKKEYDICFVDGRPPQGFPTSPLVANIALITLDKAILREIKGKPLVFTRYVDDICISSHSQSIDPKAILSRIEDIVKRCGLKPAKHKTRIQYTTKGDRRIVGVAVSDEIKATRDTKRRLRAAKHQGNKAQIKGLTEWAALKSPKPKQEKKKRIRFLENYPLWVQERIREARILASYWGLRVLEREWGEIAERQLPDEQVGEAIITTDPCLILGASTFTNFSSCLRQGPNGERGGEFRRTTILWARFASCRLFYLPSKDEIMSIARVSRPRIRARCWLFTMDDEDLAADRIYPKRSIKRGLTAEQQESAGKLSIAVSSLPRGLSNAVKGNVRAPRSRIHCDTFSASMDGAPNIWKFVR